MDIGIAVGVVMLIVWAIGTFALMAPGWIHLFLTLGVFVLIWRIVVLGTPPGSRRGDGRPQR
jgi:hypothetical protein